MLKYTSEHLDFLKNNFIGRNYKELCSMFNEKFKTQLTTKALQSTCKRHGMLNGLDGRFKKGHTPVNKGLKGVGGHPPTYFKKGHIPKNHKPVGSERFSNDGYLEVKIAEPNKWRAKHKIIWEKVNGSVPVSYTIVFADGDKQNLDINNLLLVSRAELLYLNRNKLIFKDADLTKASAKVAKITNLIFMHKQPETIKIMKEFLRERNISFLSQKSSSNIYIYFMKKYAVRISDHLPQSRSSIKTKATFNLGNYEGADGGVDLCKKWICKIVKKQRN